MASSWCSCCSFRTLFIISSIILLLLSAASLLPTIALKMPVTAPGWVFPAISSVSLFSSIFGFYSHLAPCCYFSLLLSALACQAIGIAILAKEKWSKWMPQVAVLVRAERGLLVAMFVMQIVVAFLTIAINRINGRIRAVNAKI